MAKWNPVHHILAEIPQPGNKNYKLTKVIIKALL